MSSCCVCQKQVYPAEALQYQSKVYHKSCFKCTQCKNKLNLSNVRSFDKLPYCQHHSPQTNRMPQPIDVVVDNRPPPQEPVEPPSWLHTRKPATQLRSSAQPTVPQVPDQHLEHDAVPFLSPRTSVLATGYDAFQSQIEVAGQIFTVDPVVRQKIFNMFQEFNIIVCGSARVGKSTLINAICGQTLAQTNPGLDACTRDISRYLLQETCLVDNEVIRYTYNFWDTPGFESWNETDIRTNFKKIMEKPKSDPLCMIYCASPGSFADTQQLKWLLDVCILEHKLLCALVVTNKWAGERKQRLAVLDKFQELLSRYHKQTSKEDGIIYFGNVGLCTMVNSQAYIDEDSNIHHEEEGVDELVEGIMTCLDDDGKVFHWCMAVMKKKGILNNFRGKMKQQYGDLKHFFAKRFTKSKT